MYHFLYQIEYFIQMLHHTEQKIYIMPPLALTLKMSKSIILLFFAFSFCVSVIDQ
jgi:hypothetical protein